MPPQQSEWEKQMQALDAEIRRLEAEFNMFFAGRLPRPPSATKARVAALVKKYDNGYIRNTADRFRFESLQSRYQKFIELCDRQLTNRELGRPMLGARREPPKRVPEAAERVVRFGRDAGDDRVTAQVSKLGGDGTDVDFKVAVKDGKVLLTLKAEKSGEGPS